MTTPNHCKNCRNFTQVNRKGMKNPTEKTPWCCAQGQRADHAVGHCKLNNLKELKL